MPHLSCKTYTLNPTTLLPEPKSPNQKPLNPRPKPLKPLSPSPETKNPLKQIMTAPGRALSGVRALRSGAAPWARYAAWEFRVWGVWGGFRNEGMRAFRVSGLKRGLGLKEVRVGI